MKIATTGLSKEVPAKFSDTCSVSTDGYIGCLGCTELRKSLCTRLWECNRQVEAEVISNSRNKIHQSMYEDFFSALNAAQGGKVQTCRNILHDPVGSQKLVTLLSIAFAFNTEYWWQKLVTLLGIAFAFNTEYWNYLIRSINQNMS